MNPPSRRKTPLIFCFLLIVFLLVQSYVIHFLDKPFLLASLFSFLIAILFSYFILNLTARPPRDNAPEVIRQMEAEIRAKVESVSREKDYLQAILGGMAEGVLVVDQEGHVLFVNDALRRLFTLPAEPIKKTPLELIRSAELEDAIQKAIREEIGSSFELSFPFLEKTFVISVVGLPPSSAGKERQGAVAVFHDVSRLKELEKIRQDFVANVSHELRTPLTTIKGYAETLLEGALNEPVAFQFVQTIKRQTDRLTHIVEDLLTLSKIEFKDFPRAYEKIPLSEFIENVLDFMKEALDDKKLSVRVQVSPSALVVRMDRGHLEQVLANLLDNAIKYSHVGGKIRVLVLENGQDEIQVSIKDEGIGMTKEDLPRIFERFYRAEKGRSQESGGTGLGLSIVRHLVQAHGGKVWAESRPGQGSTFFFTLPCSLSNSKWERGRD